MGNGAEPVVFRLRWPADRTRMAALELPAGASVQLVDVEGARRGRFGAWEALDTLAGRGLRVWVGGGIRSERDARAVLRAGAWGLLLATLAATDYWSLDRILDRIGPHRTFVCLDVAAGRLWVEGRSRDTGLDPMALARTLYRIAVHKVILAVLDGPAEPWIDRLARETPLEVWLDEGERVRRVREGSWREAGI